MDGDAFAATDLAHPLVGLALDAHAAVADAESVREPLAHRVDVRRQLRRAPR